MPFFFGSVSEEQIAERGFFFTSYVGAGEKNNCQRFISEYILSEMAKSKLDMAEYHQHSCSNIQVQINPDSKKSTKSL